MSRERKVKDNQEIISQYITWCETEKRFSGETILTYFSTLKAFRKFLDGRGQSILTINTGDMREYFIGLNERKDLSKISVNDYRAVLKAFFNYLLDQKLIQLDPMEKVGPQKFKKSKHDALTMEQLEKLISQVDEAGTFLFRDTIMFELFWNSGLRTSELSNLKESHIKIVSVKVKVLDDEGKEIGEKTYKVYEIKVVEGKGGKDRFVTVSETTTRLIKEFLSGKHVLYPATQYLFPSKRGKKMNRRQVYSVIANFLKLTSTKKKGAHVLRHTYATMMLNNGVSIMKVKELLGHSSVATTTIYAKPSKEMMKEAFNKAHPKGDKGLVKKSRPSIGTIKNYKFEA